VITSKIDRLADAVADGDPVDWPSAEASLTTEADRAIATQLRGIAGISGPDAHPHRPSTGRRLPRLLRAATWVGWVTSAAGLLGFLLTYPSTGGSRPVPLILALVVFGSVASWLNIMGQSDRRALALSGMYWAVAAAFSAAGVRRLSRTELIPFGMTMLLALRPEAFLSAFLWQFARDFPAQTRFGRVDRICTAGLVAALIAACVLQAASVTVRWHGAIVPDLTVLDRSYRGGQWFWVIVFVTAVPALAAIWIRGRSAEGTERSRVRLFVCGVILALAPVIAEVLIESLSPSYSHFTRTPGGRTVGGLIVYPPLFAFPIFTAFVLLDAGVLDIRVAAQRALHYVLTRWFISWGTSLPIVLLAGVLYVNRSQSVAVVLATPAARVLLWTAIVGAVLLACRGALLRTVDRWMLRGVADPAVMLARAGHDLRTARTLMELASVVAAAAERTLQAETDVYIVEAGNRLVSARTGGTQQRGQGHTSLVPVLVQGAGGPCMVDPRVGASYYDLLSTDDRAWIHRDDIMAVCPIVTDRDGRVLALMTLQKRRSALRLSEADMQFLAAACAAATLAHSGPATPEAAAPVEELGLVCTTCSRVEAWPIDSNRCACGGDWERAALPKTVRGYLRLDKRLGAGGMGVVYQATDLTLDRAVAVKTLPALSPAAAERLLQEARSMAALSHPHIAVLYAAELWRGTPILVVELLEGGTMESWLREHRPSASDALGIVARLAETLDYMHTQGRCHGDIKPSNVGFTANGVAKFLDFGLSRSLYAGAESACQVGGTLAYLAPEVLSGAAPGPAADVWALSVVLFEAVAGYHPFLHATETVARIKAGVTARVAANRSAPPAIVDLLQELLSPRPHDRPATARDLLIRLNSVRTA
jgi:hypothetical protein